MNRNTVTTAGALMPGDRFYKLVDKKKITHQIVGQNSKKTGFRTDKVFCCCAEIIDGLMHASAKSAYYKPIMADTAVVFLRNIYE